MNKCIAESIPYDLTEVLPNIDNQYSVTILMDKDFRPLYLSRAYTRITGWTQEQHEKKLPHEKFHPEDLEMAVSAMQRALLNPEIPIYLTPRINHADGHYLYVETVITNKLNDPEVNAIVVNFRDVSRLKEVEKEMQRTIRRLNTAQTLAHLGSWEIDFATQTSNWSEECLRIYGLTGEDNKHILYEQWLSFIHPDDLAFVKAVAEESQSKLEPASFIHRIVRPDGTVRWLNSQNEFNINSEGRPVGLFGICYDITDKKASEEKIKYQGETLGHIAFLQSHQVLAPISNILGLINLYNEENICDPLNLEIISQVKIAGQNLRLITGNIIRETNNIEKLNCSVK